MFYNYIFLYNIKKFIKIAELVPTDLINIVSDYCSEEMTVKLYFEKNYDVIMRHNDYRLSFNTMTQEVILSSNKINCYNLINNFYSDGNIYWRCINNFLLKFNKKEFMQGCPHSMWYPNNDCFHHLLSYSSDTIIICDSDIEKKYCYANIFLDPPSLLIALDLFRETLNLLNYDDVIKDDTIKNYIKFVSSYKELSLVL
jgi:hypothetical protein